MAGTIALDRKIACKQAADWLRLQELVAPAGAVGLAAAEPVTGTQALWQFMA